MIGFKISPTGSLMILGMSCAIPFCLVWVVDVVSSRTLLSWECRVGVEGSLRRLGREQLTWRPQWNGRTCFENSEKSPKLNEEILQVTCSEDSATGRGLGCCEIRESKN